MRRVILSFIEIGYGALFCVRVLLATGSILRAGFQFLRSTEFGYRYGTRKGIADEQGTEIYKRACELIPGGTQFLSKRSEVFLPEGGPAYYVKANGAARSLDFDLIPQTVVVQ